MQLIVKVAGFGKPQNIKWEFFCLGAFRLNFVTMETMTITVKTKKNCGNLCTVLLGNM
jgi:hypothetical protein